MTDRFHRLPKRPVVRLLAGAVTLALAAACTNGDDTSDHDPAAPSDEAAGTNQPDETLTVYARDKETVEPLFEMFEQQTGTRVRARWGDPIDLAKQVIEDGAGTPADVFYSPVADALGALNAAGRLTVLSGEQLDRVPDGYRSPDDTWVGIVGRAHVVFYNTDLVGADDLPDSILGFADPAWHGRIGWDPTSRSLQSAITALRQLEGEDKTRSWLQGIQANAPAAFEGTAPIVAAVAAGEIIEVGLGSHTYLNDLQSEGDATNVAAKFYVGDPAGLLNESGIGIINSTDDKAAANAFVDFMLSPTTQRHIVELALEIPLVESVEPPAGMPTAAELSIPNLNVQQLENLDSTRDLLAELGIIL